MLRDHWIHLHFFARTIDTNYDSSRIDLRDNQIWPHCLLRLMLPFAGVFNIIVRSGYQSLLPDNGIHANRSKRNAHKAPSRSIHSISSARSTAMINTKIGLVHLKLSHGAVMPSGLGFTSDLGSPFSTRILRPCVQLTNSARVASQSDLAISNLSKSSSVPPFLL